MATDTILEKAVDQAREAATELTEHGVGDHLGFYLEGERVGTHRFAAQEPGYVGWHWAVTMARPPRARKATISEVELLPGQQALLAPEWLPWAERLRPGDLKAGDTLPYQADDHRLDQGYEQTDDVEADRVAIYELGLGRARVLSMDGRAEAFTRWYEGEGGPNAEVAKKASATCSTCGFFMKMSGAARRIFGVCANEWSPSDGRVVSLDHGCGAHSETDVRGRRGDWRQSTPVIDEGEMEVIQMGEIRPKVVEDPAAPSGEDVPSAVASDDDASAPSSEDAPPAVGSDEDSGGPAADTPSSDGDDRND